MRLADIESSFLRHLYENLEVASGIKIFEHTNQIDFTTFTRWVVLDTLSNSLGNQPKQLWFVHCAVQKGLKHEKAELTSLVDTVLDVVDQGTRFMIYDDEGTGDPIGEMEVCEASLSPVLQHAGGGSFRSITVGLVY